MWTIIGMIALSVGIGLVDLDPAYGQTAKTERPKGEALPAVSTILDWLPTDTETLVVTKGPYQLTPMQESNARSARLGQALEWHSSFPLNARNGIYLRKLRGCEIALAVEGARHFRSATSLGLWPYEGCHVLVFHNDLGSAGESLCKALAKDAVKVQKIGEHDMFSLEEKLEADLWRFHFAQPMPNILLCGTDHDYLVEVLKRMDRPGGARALPVDLPEWKYVDTTARFWAIRHYNTAPRTRDWSDPASDDPHSVGLTVAVHRTVKPGNETRAIVTYLSRNANAVNIATKAWTYPNKPTWRPKVRHVAPGAVEFTALLRDKEAMEFAFLLFGRLGHPINT